MEDSLNIVKEIVLKKIPLEEYSVFLFGSRAVGSQHQMSDIDVGIWGQKPLPLLLKSDLEEELEECIVPYKVDVIDFFNVSDEFKKYALENINVWNFNKNSQLNYQI